jgi:hypothetical protein
MILEILFTTWKNIPCDFQLAVLEIYILKSMKSVIILLFIDGVKRKEIKFVH